MKEIREAILRAEKELGFEIAGEDADEVLMYSVQKCKAIKKDMSYLPILYENELRDYFFRLAINSASERKAVC